jgi:hypothetical protein
VTPRADPADVSGMLNSYWAVTVPVVVSDYGGLIERLWGYAAGLIRRRAEPVPRAGRPV